MVPLVKDKNGLIGFNQFKKELINTSEEARDSNNILSHCLLIYDKKNAYMSKILNDFEMYNALDEISGSSINIYHALPQKIIQRKINKNQLARNREEKLPVNIYEDSAAYNETISKLKEEIGLDHNNCNPIMIFLNIENKEIIEFIGIELEQSNNKDSLYNEILEIINVVKKSLSEVQFKYKENRKEIFSLQEQSLKFLKGKKFIRRVVKWPIVKFLLWIK